MLSRDQMSRLVDVLGIPDLRPSDTHMDPNWVAPKPGDIGKLNPARLNPDSPATMPPVHGTYKYVTKADDGGTREVDSGIPYTVTAWGADGKPAQIRPVIDTPEMKLNWDTYQDKVAEGTMPLSAKLQRAEVKRIVEQEKAAERGQALRDSYKTPAERDIEFQQKVMRGVATTPWHNMTQEQQVNYAGVLATKLGLMLRYIPKGIVYQSVQDPETGEWKSEPFEQRSYVAMHAFGIQYGPTDLTMLAKRLEIDVKERERKEEKAALMAGHDKTLAQQTVTSVWVNDRMIEGAS